MIASYTVSIWIWITLVVSSSQANEEDRFKRIINGRPLKSHDTYRTGYFVQLKNVWNCVTNQFDHNLTDCEQKHWCSGALVHDTFVLTACHCTSYTIFYSGQYTPTTTTTFPMRNRSDPYRSWSYPFHRQYELSKTKVKGYHPLYNSMAIFAGHSDVHLMSQRRHASAFYPHSLCNNRSEEIYVGDPSDLIYPIEYDVGLIKTCYPFKTGKTISLAPIHPTTNLAPDLRDALLQKKVCLFAGWGEILAYGEKLGGQTKLPNVLFHEWRHIDCSPECTFGLRCVICSSHHGHLLSYATKTDSGLPVVCDGKMIGVHNSAGAYFNLNVSFSLEFPIACTDKYLATRFLVQLAELKDNIFHYLDGDPVTFRNRLRREVERDFTAYDHSLSSQLFCRHSHVVFFIILLNFFARNI